MLLWEVDVGLGVARIERNPKSIEYVKAPEEIGHINTFCERDPHVEFGKLANSGHTIVYVIVTWRAAKAREIHKMPPMQLYSKEVSDRT